MATVVLNQEYIKTLELFGDVEEQINTALEEYVTRRIIERIKTSREHVAHYERDYQMPYATFSERVVVDEALYRAVRERNPLWEQDLLAWEYWEKETQEWTQKLNSILSKS